ncbi:MAG TPA: shikimate kinase, partial [Caldilineaceae bacterium]|nr:shikimate kinase [Caldilineaceae bacterium]
MHTHHFSSPQISPDKNIVLTGFMGTGKTTIGQLLADRLDRRFVDMDTLLTEHFGQPIAAVFSQQGESVFRTAERTLCRQLAEERGLVISTGGGALVDPLNRQVFAATGVLLCLTATVEEILHRVESNDERPLLGERTARHERITTLLARRREAYEAIPYQVDTTGFTPTQIVEQVLAALAADAEAPGMTRLPVCLPTEQYDLCLGDGLLAHA